MTPTLATLGHRTWQFGVGALAAWTLAACTQGAAPPAASSASAASQPSAVSTGSTSRLVFASMLNMGPLNPHLYSPNQMMGQAMVYESLVKYEKDGTVVPWLAESWEISPDGKTYTFKLRPNVKFSDGSAFDAEAVKKNVDAVLANRKRHEWLELINQIERAEVVDAGTVRIVLKSSYYPFLQDMALVRPLRFLAPSSIPANGNTAEGMGAPIGTGPWAVVELKRGEYDLFKRNPHYWGTQPVYDEVMFKVLPDPNSRTLALESGQVDIVYGDGPVTPDAFARFKTMPDRFVAEVSQPLATRVLAINSKRFPTDDLAVRQAMQHVVNKDAIIKNVLYDIEKKADTLFASNVPNANLGLKPFDYNPDEAARLLDAAGWKLAPGEKVRKKDGKPLAVDLCFVGNEGKDKSISEVLQADLGKAGIQVNLVGEEASAKQARERDGTFHLIFNATFGPPYDPHSFVGSMRKPSHADYQAQAGLPMKTEIDQKITQVLLETDPAKRREMWRWILTTLHEQAVYLPLSYKTLISVHNNKRVGNVQFGATNNEVPIELMQPVK
ncbi:MAG: nickel ABC transporter substrate-binding protein [Brachymonas sp.]|nr:nickel ABC transporter substrate-binding protein [Brachymonas sp.]